MGIYIYIYMHVLTGVFWLGVGVLFFLFLAADNGRDFRIKDEL